MVARSILLALPLAISVLGAPQVKRNDEQVVLNIQVPDQKTPEPSEGHGGNNIIINIFENPADVQPMCRPNGTRCKFNSSCCSQYCSWHGGYKCADKKRRSDGIEDEEYEEEDHNDI